MERFDVVVIGGGGAGITASVAAARWGAKVLLCERSNKTGGDCTWTGCIPSKALIKCASVMHSVRTSTKYGIVAGVGVPPDPAATLHCDFAAVKAHLHKSQNSIYEHDDSPEVLQRHGVQVRLNTEVRFTSSHVLSLHSIPASTSTTAGNSSGTNSDASVSEGGGGGGPPRDHEVLCGQGHRRGRCGTYPAQPGAVPGRPCKSCDCHL